MRLFTSGLCLISPFPLSQIHMVWCTHSCFFSDLDKHHKLHRQWNIQQYNILQPQPMLLQRKHTSPWQKESPRAREVSLTAAPLQTASACRGRTAGRRGACPGRRPVPCRAFQLLASAPGPCHPANKHSTQLQCTAFCSRVFLSPAEKAKAQAVAARGVCRMRSWGALEEQGPQ